MKKRLINSEVVQEILKELDEEPNYPKHLADSLDRNRSNISKLLSEMSALNLVEAERRKANYYQLTDKGEEFLRRVSQLQQEKEELIEWLYEDTETS